MAGQMGGVANIAGDESQESARTYACGYGMLKTTPSDPSTCEGMYGGRMRDGAGQGAVCVMEGLYWHRVKQVASKVARRDTGGRAEHLPERDEDAQLHLGVERGELSDFGSTTRL